MEYDKLHKIRKLARKTGFNKILTIEEYVKKAWWQLLYRYEKKEIVRVGIGGMSAQFMCNDVEEFTRIKYVNNDSKILEKIGSFVEGEGCFWDIGSSIGLYACIIGNYIKGNGQVVCFEPDERSIKRLKENIQLNNLDNVEALGFALGSRAEKKNLKLSTNVSSGTHRIEDDRGIDNDGYQEIEVRVGDEVVKSGTPFPNVIKIDVEGFEEDVLDGLSGVISDERVSMVVCEVHFSILDEKSEGNAASRIRSRLEEAGFDGIEWLDRSHICAYRA